MSQKSIQTLATGLLLCLFGVNQVQATEEFFVPFPEDHTLSFLQGISSDASCNGTFPAPDPDQPVNTVTDFVVRIDNTVIVVDHWEDGYETDLVAVGEGAAPISATTRVYGDGNLANGAVPGVTTDAGDVLTQGQVVVFEESINTATQLGDIEVIGQPITGGGTRTQDGLDGGDRVFATETINVTRAQWSGTYDPNDIANSQSGTLFAGAFELFPLSQWGDSFTLPAGEDSGATEFQWTGVTVMAANDGTSVSIDANADGDFTDPDDVDAQVINRGETIEVLGRNDIGGQTTGGLNQGARIFSSDIVQVNIISGQECSNYASRWFTLFPDALLGNTYYEPVSTPVGDETVIYLYNPSLNPLTINWETTAGLQTPIVIPPGETFAQVIPSGTGAKFFTGSTATFGAFTAIDQAATAHDWGHASTSNRLMGNVVQVGYAEGDDPSSDTPYFVDSVGDGQVNWFRYNGAFTDTTQIDTLGAFAGSGTDNNIDLAGNSGDNFGLIHQGFIKIEEVGTYTFATTSDDGSRLFIGGIEVVTNDANQPPTQVTGTINFTQTGWFPIEVRFREVGGGEFLSAQYQPPSASSLVDIPSNILSTFSPVIGENASPVWVTGDNPSDPSDTQFELCVDVSGDGGVNTDPNTGRTYDYSFTLDRLDSARVYDGGRDTPNNVPAHIDGDQSGMLIFVCDGSDAILAAAWGQDPNTASGGAPAVDVGTTVRSVSADVAYIGDTVYEDENGNGVRDPGERGIENVTVILTPPPSVNLGSGPGQPIVTSTDFNGSYLFSNLVNGDYTIEVIPPASFTQTEDPDLQNGDPLVLDNTSTPSITDSSGRLDQDFGYVNNVPAGQVGDFIYNDVNGNGIQEPGELGIPGIDVQLCFDTLTDVLVATEEFSAQAYNNNAAQWESNWIEVNDDNSPTTAVNGNQGFFITAGGELSVRGNANGPSITREIDLSASNTADLQFDWRGADDFYEAGDEVYVQVSTDGINFITLFTIEGQVIDNNSGSESIAFNTQGSASVFIRFEVNAGNFFGGGENLFLDNIRVTERQLTQTCQTETTDANGNYLFTSLPDGLYTITVLNPPSGTVNTDDPSGDSNNTNQFTLYNSGGNLEQDFGYFTPATVIGHVYLDTNGNGVQDLGEPNVANLDVEITDSLGNLHIVTTDANGDYTVDVPPGTTQVALDQTDSDYPTGFIQTDGIDPNTVIAVAGTTVDAGDDGYYQGNVIGDTVYSEEDGTPGAQGAGDPGISNVLVTLTPPAGIDLGAGAGVPITTTTDANGNYSFVGLPDGTYTVTVAQPSGSAQTEDPDGGNDNTSVVTVSGGVTNDAQDFGYDNTVPQGLIGDRVYTDINGNGVQDAGEPGIAGITVQICGDLDDNNSTPNTCRTEITDADGDYLFGDNFEADGVTGDAADNPLPATDGTEVYTVTILNPPAGQINSDDPDAGLPNFSQLTLSNAGGNLDQDFGYYQPGIVTGHLYIDTNGNGTQEAGEPDLVNVDVVITDANGNQQTVSTDSNGDYVAQVPPGNTIADVDETDPQYPLNHQQTEGTDPTSVTAIAGSTVSAGIDGYAPFGSIGDFIFFDSATGGTTGVFDPGIDVGIPNVTVSLTPPAGVDLGNGPGVAITTTTDTNGNYTFGTLPAGDYTVTVTQPSNTNATVDPNESGACTVCDNSSLVTITAGTSNNLQDFGYQTNTPNGRIGDRVFTDSNGNGVQDLGEPGIAGIIVQICGDLDDNDATPDTCRTETTDADGDYLFGDSLAADGVTADPADTGLPATTGTEDYTITITNPPAGQVNTADPDGGTESVAQLTLPSGISNLDQDFGYVPALATIAGNVSEDTTGNGLGDTALSGVTIQLYSDPNGDGDPSDGVLIDTVVTNGAGDYQFTNVPANNTDYVLVEIDPANYQSVSDAQSLDGDAVTNINTNNNLIPVTVSAGETDGNNNFIDARPASVAGQVWLDEDQDGINDIEETGLTGITVELVSGGVVIATVTTDATGNYLFDGVLPGDYTINVDDSTLPAGLTNTAGFGGTDPKPVTVEAGDQIEDIDFGYIASTNTGIIGDRVWSDANSDGIQDAGEAGIAGVIVELLDVNGVVVATTTTNTNGDYLFTNVPYGDDYVVSIDSGDAALTGFSPTSGPQSEGGYVSHPVNLDASITTVTDVDFGFNTPNTNTIVDTVWFDSNNDGIFDVDEFAIEGVTVNLYNDSNNDGIPDDANGDGQPDVVATATTDNNGDVSFTGLLDGSYVLGVTDTNSELLGLNGTTPEGIAQLSDTVSVAGGVTDDQDSFGYNNPGLIEGTVYSDANSNQNQDAGETGINRVTVTLLQDTDGNGTYETTVSTLETNPDGSYVFDGLPPGDYQVVVTPPAGTQTEDPDLVMDDATEITLNVGDSSVGNDFGYNDPSLNDILGTVFLDPDKDGVEDAGETGIAGISLELAVPPLTILDGGIDVNGDGVRSGADDGGQYLGYDILNGRLDINGDGATDGADDGVVNGIEIINGFFDINGDGSTSAANRVNDDGVAPAAVLSTTVTDANGDYQFPGLPDGDYQISVTDNDGLLAGYDITSGLDVIERTVAGADETDVDFGYINEEASGSISGEVFLDENSDAAAQASEANYSNVDVYLCTSPIANAPCDPSDPEFVAQTQTDASGEYVFNGLVADQYTVSVDSTDLPTGLQNTVEPNTIALAEGENVTEQDFGYEPVNGLINGLVWVDANDNGIYDSGEAPIAGVEISVFDPETGATAIGTVVTGPDGSWSFPVDPLDTNLYVTYDATDIPSQLDSAQPSNLPLGDVSWVNIDVTNATNNVVSDLNFGFTPAPAQDLGSIAGTIYFDVDQDASHNAVSDDEFQGVSINLVDALGNIIATTFTDADGNYSFTGLLDGNYTVEVSDTNNVLQNLNVNESITSPVVISGGNDVTDVDQGYISDAVLGSVGNLIWIDTDQDGFADDGEPRVSGVTVQCWLDADNSATADSPGAAQQAPQPGIDNLIRTVTTDENGEYNCSSLPDGQYIVVVTDVDGQLAGYTSSAPNNAANDAGDNWAKPLTYAVTASNGNVAADFGVIAPASIAGTVYFDENADSTYQPTPGGNDSSLEGIAVQACRASDNSCVTVYTDTNGDYFIPVTADDWTVTVLTPPAGTESTEDDGTNPITVTAGDAITDINFGFTEAVITTTPVSVAYFKAADNGGGVTFTWQTAMEVGAAGFQLYMRTESGWELVNQDMIPSKVINSMDSTDYEYTVYNKQAKWFALVEVSVTEHLTVHGPYQLDEIYGEVNGATETVDFGSDVQPDSLDLTRFQHRLNRLKAGEQ